MALEQDIANLVQSTNALTDVVDGKIQDIDNKVNTSLQQARNEYNSKANNLTIIATDGYRKAVEAASGGRNTVIYDDQGNPNVMVVIPRFNCEDLELPDLNLGTGTHPAFVTGGVPRGEILVGKYLASSAPGGCAVVGGVQPRTSVNYDTAKQLCTAKGTNWHLMSAHEWAAIALWCLANGTIPRGNTNYGRAHDAKWETARRHDNGIPGDTDGTGRTDTGKGPVTWSHDHTEFGVADLVGNVWEWIDQMKLNNGQVITTLDNNPFIGEAGWSPSTAYFDSSSASQEGTGNVGSPVLANSVTNRNGPMDNNSHDFPSTSNNPFSAISKDAGYTQVELLRRLLVESASPDTVPGALYVRNYGERMPRRGGSWSHGSSAGLGALVFNPARSYSDSLIGFRPAFFA